MRKLKIFIYERKEPSKTNDEFFEENRSFFEQYNVQNYSELIKLIQNYDRENPEDALRDERERYKKYLKIEHIKGNDLSILMDIKKYKDSTISLNSGINNIYITNSKNYFKIMENCNQIKEYNFIPDKKEYFINKIKKYEIKNLNDEIDGIKKTKFNNESELIQSSNINNITLEKISHNVICSGDNYTQDGIPIEELRNRKIKKMISNLSKEDQDNLEKVETIFGELKNKDENISVLDDIFCIKCNKSFKNENAGEHTGHCTLQINNELKIDNDINNLDYNTDLNKIYEYLKKDQNKIIKSGNRNLMIYYGKLLYSLYEIIINNNSIEELSSSIIKINDDYNKENGSQTFNDFFKEFFLFYIQRISKLTYFKEKKMEQILVDIEDENKNVAVDMDIFDEYEEKNNNLKNNESMPEAGKHSSDNIDAIISPKMSGNLDNINYTKLSEEDKKKYFLKIGITMKSQYKKNVSLIELYSKAKELNLEPHEYEDFLMKELEIIKT